MWLGCYFSRLHDLIYTYHHDSQLTCTLTSPSHPQWPHKGGSPDPVLFPSSPPPPPPPPPFLPDSRSLSATTQLQIYHHYNKKTYNVSFLSSKESDTASNFSFHLSPPNVYDLSRLRHAIGIHNHHKDHIPRCVSTKWVCCELQGFEVETFCTHYVAQLCFYCTGFHYMNAARVHEFLFY